MNVNKKIILNYLIIKRVIDIFVSILILFIISPLFLLISLLIFVTMGRPIFFKQMRPGKNENLFKLYKFRTMTNKRRLDGKLLPDSSRITVIGSFLRKTSIDELPELFNVVKGDMSLVGPRPLLVEYLPYYTDKEKIRHTVRPGITGLAQVHGRNLLGWQERLEKDIEYVEKMNFFLDIEIILKTILIVFQRKGAALNIIDDFDVHRKKKNFMSTNENASH